MARHVIFEAFAFFFWNFSPIKLMYRTTVLVSFCIHWSRRSFRTDQGPKVNQSCKPWIENLWFLRGSTSCGTVRTLAWNIGTWHMMAAKKLRIPAFCSMEPFDWILFNFQPDDFSTIWVKTIWPRFLCKAGHLVLCFWCFFIGRTGSHFSWTCAKKPAHGVLVSISVLVHGHYTNLANLTG